MEKKLNVCDHKDLDKNVLNSFPVTFDVNIFLKRWSAGHPTKCKSLSWHHSKGSYICNKAKEWVSLLNLNVKSLNFSYIVFPLIGILAGFYVVLSIT